MASRILDRLRNNEIPEDPLEAGFSSEFPQTAPPIDLSKPPPPSAANSPLSVVQATPRIDTAAPEIDPNDDPVAAAMRRADIRRATQTPQMRIDRPPSAVIDRIAPEDPRAVARAGGWKDPNVAGDPQDKWDPQKPKLVDVPGKGQISFPGEMSDEDIGIALRKNFPDELGQSIPAAIIGGIGQGAVQTATEGALRPFELSKDIAVENTRRAQLGLGRFSELRPDEQQALRSWARQALSANLVPLFDQVTDEIARGVRDPDNIPDLQRLEGDRNYARMWREAAQSFARRVLPVAPEYEKPMGKVLGMEIPGLATFARGLGSTAGFLGTRLLPGGAVLLPMFAGSSGSAEAIQDAIQAGATTGQITDAAGLGIFPGLLDVAAIENLLRPFSRAPGLRGLIVASAKKAVEQGAVEGIQEGIQQIGQNLIARGLYDPERGMLKEVDGNVMVGFVTGALMGGATGASSVPVAGAPIPSPAPPPVAPQQPASAPQQPTPQPAAPATPATPPAPPTLTPAEKAAADLQQTLESGETPEQRQVDAESAATVAARERGLELGKEVSITFDDGQEVGRVDQIWADESGVPNVLIVGKTDRGEYRVYEGPLDALQGEITPVGDGTRTSPRDIKTPQDLDATAPLVNQTPTPGQAEAGNYQKAHHTWNGLDIAIETPKGGTRVAKDGSWQVTDFPAAYGYVKSGEGADGDKVDIFMGPSPDSRRVFVIDQIDPKSEDFDEHKVMLGFPDETAALDAYTNAFTDDLGVARVGAVTAMSVDQFKNWLKSGNTKAALGYEKIAAPPTAPAVPEPAPAPAAPEPAPAPPPPSEYGSAEAPNVTKLGGMFARNFVEGRRYASIGEARRAAREALGVASLPKEALKPIDEAIEYGVVEAARAIAAGAPDPDAAYTALVRLYSEQQPILAQVTSDSMRRQAYSTPAPIAFVASRLAGVREGQAVLEPTAGTGMLLMEATPERAIANEIDPTRAAILQAQGFLTASIDATSDNAFGDAQTDVVIANPPFGAIKRQGGTGVKLEGQGAYTTIQIDHAIAGRALATLRPDGRAVLILAGVNARDPAARAQSYKGKQKGLFFNWLKNNFNVVDHFTVDGKLYQRQGAGWPVDVVVIRGRGQSALPHPGDQPPPIISNWADLRSKLHAEYPAQSRPVSAPGPAPGPDVTGPRPGQPGGEESRPGGLPDGPGENGGVAAPGRPGSGSGSSRPAGTPGGGGVAGGKPQRPGPGAATDRPADAGRPGPSDETSEPAEPAVPAPRDEGRPDGGKSGEGAVAPEPSPAPAPDGGELDFDALINQAQDQVAGKAEAEAPAAEPKAPSGPRRSGIPKDAELEKIVFKQPVEVEDTSEVLTMERNARELLDDAEAEVNRYKRLLACLKQ